MRRLSLTPSCAALLTQPPGRRGGQINCSVWVWSARQRVQFSSDDKKKEAQLARAYFVCCGPLLKRTEHLKRACSSGALSGADFLTTFLCGLQGRRIPARSRDSDRRIFLVDYEIRRLLGRKNRGSQRFARKALKPQPKLDKRRRWQLQVRLRQGDGKCGRLSIAWWASRCASARRMATATRLTRTLSRLGGCPWASSMASGRSIAKTGTPETIVGATWQPCGTTCTDACDD